MHYCCPIFHILQNLFRFGVATLQLSYTEWAIFCVHAEDLWRINWSIDKIKKGQKERRQEQTVWCKSQFSLPLCPLSLTQCTPCPSLPFSLLLKTVALPSHTIFTQHCITIIKHMHGKKINSKRQHSQKPGFERLIFIFLSCPLFFYVALFFLLREMERDMPFLPACASLWCFSGLFLCTRPAQSHAQASWSSRWITPAHVNKSTEPPPSTQARPSLSTLHPLISVANEPC